MLPFSFHDFRVKFAVDRKSSSLGKIVRERKANIIKLHSKKRCSKNYVVRLARPVMFAFLFTD